MESSDEALRPDELVAQLGWVRGLARGLASDPDAADDVLQQVCLLALQRAPAGARSGPTFRAWLAAVTRSLVRRSSRTEARRERRERVAALPEALPATLDTAVHREALRHLIEALTSLEEPYYSTVVARYFEDRTMAEIAARSGDTEAAVRQRLSRARKQLRARLEARLAADAGARLRAALPFAGAGAVSQLWTRAELGRWGGTIMAKIAGKSGVAKLALGLLVLLGVFFGAREALVQERTEVEVPTQDVALASEAAASDLESPTAAVVEPLQPTPVASDAALPGPRLASGERSQLIVGVVLDGRGGAVPGAVVQVEDIGSPDDPSLALRFDIGRAQSPAVLAQTRTDEGGRFELAVGESSAQAHRHAQVGRAASPVCLPVLRASGPGLLPAVRPLVLGEGDTLDQGTIVLEAGGGLRGRVTRAGGQPVANARLLMRSHAPSLKGWGELSPVNGWPEQRTSADGRFELTGLPLGPLTVEIESEGWAILRNDPVEIEAGAFADLGTLVLADGADLEGVVNDTDGHPVQGAEVSLIGQEFLSQRSLARTRSDAAGRFELHGLALAVSQTLEARAPGLLAASAKVNVPSEQPITLTVGLADEPRLLVRAPDGKPVTEGSVAVFEGARLLEHVALTESGARLQLATKGDVLVRSPGLAIWTGGLQALLASDAPGEISLEPESTVRGVARDPAGRALGGLVVRAVARVPALKPLGFEASDITDEHGHFEIHGLCAGPWSLQAERAGLERWAQGVELSRAETKEMDVRLATGCRVEGRVSTSVGEPVAGAVVCAGPSTSLGPRATTGTDGSFVLTGVHPGPSWISIADGTGSLQLEIPPQGLTGVALVVPADASVSGRVTSGGQPVAGYVVRAGAAGSWNAGPYRALTDQDGGFELTKVKPGPLKIGVVDPGGRPLERTELTLADGERGRVDFELVVTTLRVQVRAAEDGRPIPGAKVQYSPKARFNSVSRKADESGVFELEHVRDESMWFHASAPGRLPVETTVQVYASDRLRTIDLDLPAAGVIEGRVDLQDGGSMLKLSIQAMGPALPSTPEQAAAAAAIASWGSFGADSADANVPPGADVRRVDVGRDGRFVLDGLPPGDWEVAVTQWIQRGRSGSAMVLATRSVKVQAGARATIELRVQPIRSP